MDKTLLVMEALEERVEELMSDSICLLCGASAWDINSFFFLQVPDEILHGKTPPRDNKSRLYAEVKCRGCGLTLLFQPTKETLRDV